MSYCNPCAARSCCRASTVASCLNQAYTADLTVTDGTDFALLADPGYTLTVPCDSCVWVTFSGTLSAAAADMDVELRLAVYNVLAPGVVVLQSVGPTTTMATAGAPSYATSTSYVFDLSAGTYVFQVRAYSATTSEQFTLAGTLSLQTTRKAV